MFDLRSEERVGNQKSKRVRKRALSKKNSMFGAVEVSETRSKTHRKKKTDGSEKYLDSKIHKRMSQIGYGRGMKISQRMTPKTWLTQN